MPPPILIARTTSQEDVGGDFVISYDPSHGEAPIVIPAGNELRARLAFLEAPVPDPAAPPPVIVTYDPKAIVPPVILPTTQGSQTPKPKA